MTPTNPESFVQLGRKWAAGLDTYQRANLKNALASWKSHGDLVSLAAELWFIGDWERPPEEWERDEFTSFMRGVSGYMTADA